MNRTKIEYVHYSWNPVTGCFGPGGTPDEPKRCSYCYAHRLANGRLRKLYLSNPNVAPGCDPEDPFSPRFWPRRLRQPLKRRKPAKIFVVDMGDLFHPYVPEKWIADVLQVAQAPTMRHTFLYLTKNPTGYAQTSYWRPNEWLGTTVTNQADWDERWPEMEKVEAKVRWVSVEPLLGEIDFTWQDGKNMDWAVIGAMTGRGAVPVKQRWFRWLMAELELDDVPVFHKDNLDCEGMGIQRRREMPR